MSKKEWNVYIIECADGSFYTGITNDLERRLKEHRAGEASKYTAARGVRDVVYSEEAPDRSVASTREAEIKQLSRAEKRALVAAEAE